MLWNQPFIFPAVAVYAESGEYIVHNYILNSWAVYTPTEYKVASKLIYSQITPEQLIEEGHTHSEVRQVASKLLLYRIGYQGERTSEYEMMKAIYSQGMGNVIPKSVYFVSTYKCNLNCIYCYADSSPERSMNGDLTTEEAFDLIRQVKELGAKTLIFTGGEAFLRKDVLQLMEYANAIGLLVNVITNGTFINSREKAAEVARLCNLVTISLDSLDKKEHEANRGNGTWDKAFGAIQLLHDAGGKLKINQTVTSNNKDSIDSLIEYTRSRSMRLNVTAIAQLGRGDDNQHGLTFKERRRISDRLLEEELQGACQDDCTSVSIRQFEHKRHCGHGTSEFSVDAKGYVFPCKLMHHPMFCAGSIREKSLREIWETSFVFERARERTVHTLPECGKCTFRESCGGGCRAFHWGGTGDINATWDVDCASIRRGIRKRMWASFRFIGEGGNTHGALPVGK